MRLLKCTRDNHVHQSSSRSWRWPCIECGLRVLVRRSVHPVPESCCCCCGYGRANLQKAVAFKRPKAAGLPVNFT